MKYLVRKSFVQVVGEIWMPSVKTAMQYKLTDYDVENIKAHGDGEITREAVDMWLTTNSGDFSSVDDFSASIEDGDDTIDIDWKNEENEMAYYDCMHPADY